MTDTARAERSLSDDGGMALIEITIAMFVLALVAVAFLPLLVQGITQSAANATLVSATQYVHQEIELARGSTCTAAATTRESTTVDPRGVRLRIIRTIGACPASRPGTFTVFAQVVREADGNPLAEARTLVYLARG